MAENKKNFCISRFKGVEQREYEVEIITPLFLGGADSQKAELRIPSIKGALRFWWRALYGSDDLKDMKQRESEIFGSTEKKASFDIRVCKITDCHPKLSDLPKGEKFTVRTKGKQFKLGIIDYLAFGLRDFKKGYSKEHIPNKDKFKILFYYKHQDYKLEIENSFKILVFHGGLGAKTRNGFGSLYVKDLKPVGKVGKELKKFSSFSSETILFNQFQKFDSWIDSLSELGMVYKDARLSVEPKHQYTKRLLIAKPIVQTKDTGSRHSKPYFLHVNKLADGKYQGQILFMPYQYYEPEKRKEYFETCNRINRKIIQLSGGTR